MFSYFIWAHKRPRLNRRQLSFPKIYGELAVPDIQKYQQATHLTRLIDWNRHQTTKLWPRLEQSQSNISLIRAPWCYPSISNDMKNHPLVGLTVQICSSLFSKFSLTSIHSPLYPILGNPAFPPGIQDSVFYSLRQDGYFQASHFIIQGNWPSLSELMDETGLFKLDCWRALQLTHFLWSLPSPDKFGQNLTRYETYCSGEGVLPHALSAVYLLITPPEDYQLPCLSAWEIDFGHKFTARQRQNILIFTYGSSMCTKIQETNFKIVTRWDNTPAKLQKIYPSSSDRCWRCQEDRGTILHVFWACPKLQQFWKTIQQVAQNVTGRLIPNDPAFFLLHASNIPSKSYKKSFWCSENMHPFMLEVYTSSLYRPVV